MDPNLQPSQEIAISQPILTQVSPPVKRTFPLSKIFISIFGVIIFLGLIGAAYYFGFKKHIPNTVTNGINQTKALGIVPTVIPTTMQALTTNWKTYNNIIYNQNISFKYPITWSSPTEGYGKNQPGYSINFCPPNTTTTTNCHISISIYKITEAGPSSLIEIKDNLNATAKAGNFNVNFTNMIIGGQPGQKITYSNLPELEKSLRKTEYDVLFKGIMYMFTVQSDTDDVTNTAALINTVEFKE